MQKNFIMLLLLVFCLAACQKQDNGPDDRFSAEAVVSGYVPEYGGCPGGYYINMVSEPQTNTQFMAKKMPDNSEITPSVVFPVRILLNWEMDSVYCKQQYIKVVNLKRKK